MAEEIDGIFWNDGWPKSQGWFDCLVFGEYVRLQHFICQLDGRHHWKKHGGDYETNKVLWTGEPEARE